MSPAPPAGSDGGGTPGVVLLVFGLLVGAGVVVSVGWLVLNRGRGDDEEPTDSFIDG